MILDTTQKQLIITTITAAWSAVGDDAMKSDPNLTNAQAIEIALDCDRLKAYNGRNGIEAEKLINQMVSDAAARERKQRVRDAYDHWRQAYGIRLSVIKSAEQLAMQPDEVLQILDLKLTSFGDL